MKKKKKKKIKEKLWFVERHDGGRGCSSSMGVVLRCVYNS